VDSPKNELRIVIVNRGLNQIIVQDQFLLFLPEKLIDRLQETKIMSKIDFHCGDHPGRVASDDIEKIVFIRADTLCEQVVV
jgi:hypothetical protein